MKSFLGWYDEKVCTWKGPNNIFSNKKFIFHFWSSCLKEASGPWKILIQWMPALEVTKQTQQVNRSSFSFFTISHSHTWIYNGHFCPILCKRLHKLHGCHYKIASSGKIDGQMLFECIFPRFYWLILHFFRIKIDQCENHSELLLLSNTLRSHLGRWQFFGLALYSTSMYYGKTRSKSICPSILPLDAIL